VTADSQLDAVANFEFGSIPAGGGFVVTPVTNGAVLPSLHAQLACLPAEQQQEFPCRMHGRLSCWFMIHSPPGLLMQI
jgi:hypothetical protein